MAITTYCWCGQESTGNPGWVCNRHLGLAEPEPDAAETETDDAE